MVWVNDVLVSIGISFSHLLEGVFNAVPGIIAAIIVLGIGYLVAWTIGEIVTRVLTKIKFEKWVLDHTGANTYVGSLQLSHLLGTLAKWYTWILFWAQAASLLSLSLLGNFIETMASWVPRLIVSVLVAIIGFIAAEYVSSHIVKTKARSGAIVAEIFKVVILIFTGITSLRMLGLDVTLAESTFLIVVGGVALAVALAIGIGGGLALKDHINDYIKAAKKKW